MLRKLASMFLVVTMLASVLGLGVLQVSAVEITGPGAWEGFGTTTLVDTEDVGTPGNPGSVTVDFPSSSNMAGPGRLSYLYASDAIFSHGISGYYKLTFKYKVDKPVDGGVFFMEAWNNGAMGFRAPSDPVNEWVETSVIWDAGNSGAIIHPDFSLRFFLSSADTSDTSLFPAQLKVDDIAISWSPDNVQPYEEYYPVVNYGFKLEPPDTTPPDDVTVTEVESFNGALLVRYNGSTAADLKQYNVYVNDTFVRSIHKDKKAVALMGLANDTAHTVRIEAEDDLGNKSAGSTCTGTPTFRSYGDVNGWGLTAAGGLYALDVDEKSEGKASLFFSDIVSFGAAGAPTYVQLSNGGTAAGFAAGDKLKVVFDAKFDNVAWVYLMFGGWIPVYTITPDHGTTFDWKTIETPEIVVTQDMVNGGAGINIIFDGSYADAVWLDNFKMYRQAGGEGEWILMEDNIVNANFEAGVEQVAPADVAIVSAVVQDDYSAVIEFTAPADADFTKVNVYEDGTLLASSVAGATNVIVPNLVGGVHDLIVKAADYVGNESIGVPVSVTVERPDYETSAYSVLPATILDDAKNGAVTGTASITVTNTNEPNLKGILLCGLYQGDMLMEVFVSEQKDIPADGVPVELTANISLDQLTGEGYSMKLFLWDAMLGLKPLKVSQVFPQ